MEEIPKITYKVSEKHKVKCPYCDKGILHQHIVIVDTGFVDYLHSLGDFKEDRHKHDGLYDFDGKMILHPVKQKHRKLSAIEGHEKSIENG